MCMEHRTKALWGWRVMDSQEPAFPKSRGSQGTHCLVVAVWGLGGTSALSLGLNGIGREWS